MKPVTQLDPPVLFKQGTPERLKLIFLSIVAFLLLYIDNSYQSLNFFRQAVAASFIPLEKVAQLPVDLARGFGAYLLLSVDIYGRNQALEAENTIIRQRQVNFEYLSRENQELRNLLQLRTSVRYPVVSVEILREERSQFFRKIIIDRGAADSIAQGMPVLSPLGLVGQVSRVYLSTSEVTLTVDKSLSVPVQVLRTGLRAVTYGNPQTSLIDVRFVPSNSDIKVGDDVVTSGIDSVYPAGIPVCRIAAIDTPIGAPFSVIRCLPQGVEQGGQFVVVLSNADRPISINLVTPPDQGSSMQKSPNPKTPIAN